MSVAIILPTLKEEVLKMTPLAFIDGYLRCYEPYKSNWNYEDGCVLLGCRQLYEATGDEKYLQFVLDYLRDVITPEGTVANYEMDQFNIDSINSGKALFFALDKTGEERFRKALDFHKERLMAHPRCRCGSFWHKTIYPNQVWLDGLYMAQPFYMEYETRLNNREGYQDILLQFRNVKKYLFNPQSGLSYHGWDESREQPWCDKETGCSKNYWLRSMGWYLMALIDTIEACDPAIYEVYRDLCDQFREAVKGLLPYQDKASKLFYQVIDHPEAEGNYLETSGSAMIACAIMKGARLQVLNAEKYAPIGQEIYDSLASRMLTQDADGSGHLQGICSVAGLGPGAKRDGSIAYYLSEKIVSDDPKGAGAFMMATAQRMMA